MINMMPEDLSPVLSKTAESSETLPLRSVPMVAPSTTVARHQLSLSSDTFPNKLGRSLMEDLLAQNDELKIVAPPKMSINPKIDIYIKSGGQISPVKGKESTEVEKKMAESFAKKQEETGSRGFKLSMTVDPKPQHDASQIISDACVSAPESSIVAEEATVVQKTAINTSNQVSLAKEDEIVEAEEMDAFLAEEEVTSSAEHQPVAVQMDAVTKDKVTEADNKPTECVSDKKIAIIQESAVDTSNLINPTRVDEIADAQADEIADAPTGPSFSILAHESPMKMSSVTAEELAGTEKQLKQAKLPEEPVVVDKSVIDSSAQNSPAKEDEVAEAQKRVEEFSSAKQASLVNGLPTLSTAPTLIAEKIESPTIASQLSPAKPDEIAEAQKQMDAFLAGKENLKIVAPSKMKINPKVDIYIKSGNQISPAKGNELIEDESKMAAFLEKKKEETGSTELQLSNPVDTKRQDEVPISNTECSVVADDATVVQKTGNNLSNQISPAKDDEIAEAQKRMDAFLAEKKKVTSSDESKDVAEQMDAVTKDKVTEADNMPAEGVTDKKITIIQESDVDTTNQINPISVTPLDESKLEIFHPQLEEGTLKTPTKDFPKNEINSVAEADVKKKRMVKRWIHPTPNKGKELREVIRNMKAILRDPNTQKNYSQFPETMQVDPAEEIEALNNEDGIPAAMPEIDADAENVFQFDDDLYELNPLCNFYDHEIPAPIPEIDERVDPFLRMLEDTHQNKKNQRYQVAMKQFSKKQEADKKAKQEAEKLKKKSAETKRALILPPKVIKMKTSGPTPQRRPILLPPQVKVGKKTMVVKPTENTLPKKY